MVERWGFGYDELKKINPTIIAAYQPMQGFDGPHKDFFGFGAVLNAITGYNELSGFPNRPPMGLGTNYPDYVDQPRPHADRDPRRAAAPQAARARGSASSWRRSSRRRARWRRR